MQEVLRSTPFSDVVDFLLPSKYTKRGQNPHSTQKNGKRTLASSGAPYLERNSYTKSVCTQLQRQHEAQVLEQDVKRRRESESGPFDAIWSGQTAADLPRSLSPLRGPDHAPSLIEDTTGTATCRGVLSSRSIFLRGTHCDSGRMQYKVPSFQGCG